MPMPVVADVNNSFFCIYFAANTCNPLQMVLK